MSKISAFCAIEPGFSCATRGLPSLSIPPEMVKPNGEPSFLINSIVVRPFAEKKIHQNVYKFVSQINKIYEIIVNPPRVEREGLGATHLHMPIVRFRSHNEPAV